MVLAQSPSDDKRWVIAHRSRGFPKTGSHWILTSIRPRLPKYRISLKFHKFQGITEMGLLRFQLFNVHPEFKIKALFLLFSREHASRACFRRFLVSGSTSLKLWRTEFGVLTQAIRSSSTLARVNDRERERERGVFWSDPTERRERERNLILGVVGN